MPNWRTFIASGLASICLSAPAFGSSATLDPAPLHYIGSIALTPDKGAIGAGWTIIVRDPDLDTVQFALNSIFGTALVSGPGVQGFASVVDPKTDGAVRLYAVELTPSLDGADRVVKFTYGGPIFSQTSPRAANMQTLNTLNADKIELTVDSYWFPFDTRFDTDLTAQVSVRIDGDWSAVGVGSVAPTVQGYRFVQDTPGLDIAVALLSRSVTVMAEGYDIYDARSDPGAKLAELGNALDGCTAYLNQLSGAAGPLPQASIIVTDRPDGSYSRGTLIVLSDIENEDEEALRQFICHELAHYWSKANAGGPENWINEGIADYLGNMAIRDAMGVAVFEARMARYAQQVQDTAGAAIWSPNQTTPATDLTLYRAGPLALQDLEARMGEPAFAVLMRRIMMDRIRTTPDLLALIETTTDTQTRDWFAKRLSN